MHLDYIRLSRVSLRIAARVRFPRYTSKWIISECPVIQAQSPR